MFSKEKYILNITKQLSYICTNVKLLNSLNLNDINIHAESFFCELLNIIFGYQLHNLNNTEMNYAAIDLGDEKNKIAIQVTSEKTSTKIRETLEKFTEKKYYQKYNRLIIFIIGCKPKFSASFNTYYGIEFLKERDIWDINYIVNEINKQDIHNLSRIYKYINSQLVMDNSHIEFDPTPIVESTRKKAYGLCIAKLLSIGVVTEIANKIIATDITSTKYQYIIDNVNAGKSFLTGDYGTGKSHAILILAQRLAYEFHKENQKMIPLLAHAREFIATGSIQKWIDNIQIGTYNYFLFIDGLDEIDSKDAKQLLEEIDALSLTSIDNRILVSSRPISALTSKLNKQKIMPLSIEEQSLLYSTITGDRDIKYLFLHLEKQMQIMLSKPFFVLSMHCSKQNLKIGPKQTWILLLLLLKKH